MTETAAALSRSALSRAAAVLQRGGKFILDIALPPLCPSCREPLGAGVGLCAGCWSKLSQIEKPYCARLGIPFLYDPGPGLLSMEATANPPAYQRARAAVRYDEVARSLVLAFKYADRLDLAPMMGAWMSRAGSELLAEADALMPVPLHWRRLWARRFNQAAAWPRPFPNTPAFRFCRTCSSAYAPPRSKSACQRPNAPAMCRALSEFRKAIKPRLRAAALC